MPGRVVAIKVSPGDSVTAGQEICVVEAMKMEQSIRAHRPGIIKVVHVKPMDQVTADQPLMELE
jgi:propionyl-CoA carboxylase alpha chain